MSVPADLLIYFILALGALILCLDVLRRRQLRALQSQLQNPGHQIEAALTRLESKIETEFRVLRELEQTQRSDAHQLRKELTASSDTLQQRVVQGLQDLLTHNTKALEEVAKPSTKSSAKLWTSALLRRSSSWVSGLKRYTSASGKCRPLHKALAT